MTSLDRILYEKQEEMRKELLRERLWHAKLAKWVLVVNGVLLAIGLLACHYGK